MIKCYPLTYMQKVIWKVEKFAPNTSINNIAGTLRFKESIDLKLIQQAINLLVKKNDALRIRITIQEGEPVQYVSDYQYFSLDFFDLSTVKDDRILTQFQTHLTQIPFQILHEPLFYAAVIKTASETAMYFKQHHIISDAWSIVLCSNKTLCYYLRLKRNEGNEDIHEPSFFDYLKVEEEYFQSKRFNLNKNFWQKQIETISEKVNSHIPLRNSTSAFRTDFIIPKTISSKVNCFCKKNNISILTLFSLVFSTYFNRITSKKNIVFGTTIHNRLNFKEKNTVGMFANTIPIILEFDESTLVLDYIKYIATKWKKSLLNSRYPYELIIEEYRKKYMTYNFFDVNITYQNASTSFNNDFQVIRSDWYLPGDQINFLNINISNREKTNNYLIDYDYLLDLISINEIERMHHHILNILDNIINNPNKPIASIELLSPKEKKQLVHGFNRTRKYYPYRNIIWLFEKQAQKNPDKTALIFEGQRMTYRELNEKANQTAWMLMDQGVKPNEVVGLLMKRSFEMFIGILGILKAGGAYLPIDPKFPRKRVRDILEDSNCLILLTNKFVIGNTTWKGKIVSWSAVSSDENRNNPNRRIHPNDMAYLIYTSGSTGKPKGVMIEYRGLANTIQWRTKYYRFTSEDVLLQMPPYSFDSSVEDIFSFLTVGAAIVIIDHGKRLNLKHLGQLIVDHRVTHFLTTPLLYNAMLEDIADKLRALSSITLAGDSVRLNLVQKHFAKLPQVKLYNEYGPTENSVCSTVYQFSATDQEVIIGKPISNCRCYVLNQEHHLLPVGIPGELYLGGVGLARGYINNPQLTKEKFIYIPAIKERLYKTGDLAQWTPEGNLKFMGRIDNQVKIRGYRIELGEIESNLLKHRSIKEVVVVPDEKDPNRKCLCAYYVSDDQVTDMELKEYLAKSLADYMIPSFFVPLERLPLTTNGKIDRDALPAPERNREVSLALPENPVEEKMVQVWQDVLGNSKIGTNDNFFELGGDSLDIIKILTISYNEHWDLSVQDFYKNKTIKKLAAYLISKQQIGANETKELDKVTDSADRKGLKRKSLQKMNFAHPRIVKKVLLTGATGFLGSHILFELLKLDKIKTYVLVRGVDKEDAQSRLYHRLSYYFPDLDWKLAGEKLVVINGDITKTLLGLPEPDYQLLRQKVDTVIHCAALVKHYGDERELQSINVLGVHNILKFSKDKYLAHISTLSVAGDYTAQKRQDLRFDEPSLDIGQKFDDNYYVQTKYEAEKAVLEQMQEGMDGTIIRVGNLTGRYSDGVFQPNIDENKFYQILKSLIEIGFVPDSMAETKIELTPVDLCAKAIIKLIMMEESTGNTFHVFNQNKIKAKDFFQRLHVLGYTTELIEARLFEKRIQEMIRNNKAISSLMGIISDLKDGTLDYSSSITIDSQYSIETLKHLGFVWQRINSTYIKKVINHTQSVAFIPKKYRKAQSSK